MTPAQGLGPVLLLLPSPGTEIEAWRPMRGEDGAKEGACHPLTLST